MKSRVRCTGQMIQAGQVILTECNWKGKRRPYAQWSRYPKGPGMLDLDKPCPRCGGKVGLA